MKTDKYDEREQYLSIVCADCGRPAYLADLQHHNKDGLLICDDCNRKKKGKKCQKSNSTQTKS